MYVIKDKFGAFVEQNSENSKELNYVHTSIERAQKYELATINILKERFKGTWREKEFSVFKVISALEPVDQWGDTYLDKSPLKRTFEM